MTHVLSLLLALPLFGMLIAAGIPREKTTAIRAVGIAVSILALLLSLVIWFLFDRGSGTLQFTEHGQWFTFPLPGLEPFQSGPSVTLVRVGYDLGVDGLSLPLLAMSTLVAAAAMVASWRTVERVKAYTLWFLLLEAGVNGIWTAQNLLLFFIFFELALIALFFLVGIWGSEGRWRAAYELLLYNGLGSLVMLIVFVALFLATGTSDIREIRAAFERQALPPGEQMWLVIGLLVAFGIKLPIFPFHTWVKNVHPVASAPVSMMLSGVLLKVGAYGLIRFALGFFPDTFARLAPLLVALGLINVFYGALLAFVDRDFKRIIAYSSISQMGIVLLGLAALNQIGLLGALFQLVSHGLISALLFFLAGVTYAETHTSSLDRLSGLGARMPRTAGFLMFAALASLGVPLLSGFVGEWLALLGLFTTPFRPFAIIGALSIVTSALYILRAVMRAMHGPLPDALAHVQDARSADMAPIAALSLGIVLLGVFPFLMGDLAHASLAAIEALPS
ncbi:complex I subunit 4 family protein [Kyrpidia spormannii]|nr:NADH-quinone oxidoreductase subunit M [Kyrpidia spormannii]